MNKNPENCGHGGTIHLGRGYEGEKKCKLCGAVFDGLGRRIDQ